MKTMIVPMLLVAFLSFSCGNDDDENDISRIENVFVTAVNSPATGTINQPVNIEVKFQVFNGCGRLNKFIETENGNTRIIEVEAKYEGEICTQDAPIRTVNYEFTPTKAGIYELKFKSSDEEFITANLIINQ